MPITFKSHEEYVEKLVEMVEMEGEIERSKAESYQQTHIYYEIKEHKKIVKWLDLELPAQTDLKIIRDEVLIQVRIDQISNGKPYIALGKIKKVVHLPS